MSREKCKDGFTVQDIEERFLTDGAKRTTSKGQRSPSGRKKKNNNNKIPGALHTYPRKDHTNNPKLKLQTSVPFARRAAVPVAVSSDRCAPLLSPDSRNHDVHRRITHAGFPWHTAERRSSRVRVPRATAVVVGSAVVLNAPERRRRAHLQNERTTTNHGEGRPRRRGLGRQRRSRAKLFFVSRDDANKNKCKQAKLCLPSLFTVLDNEAAVPNVPGCGGVRGMSVSVLGTLQPSPDCEVWRGSGSHSARTRSLTATRAREEEVT